MERYESLWTVLTAISVFLFTVTGLGYVTYRKIHPNYDGTSSVLGATSDSLSLKLTIEYDGERISYETDELSSGASLEDLFNAYNRTGNQVVGIRKSMGNDYIYKVNNTYSDELSWRVYINNSEYKGLFSDKILSSGDSVRIIYER